MAVKRLLLSASDTDVAQVSAVACDALKKLLSEFPKLFPSPDFSTSMSAENHRSSLVAGLNQGLLFALDGKHYNLHCTRPYASSSVRWFTYSGFLFVKK